MTFQQQSQSLPSRLEPVAAAGPVPGRRIVLVGPPNVGKSVLFNRLTGRYATVSNYPGTTVEVARGRCRALGGAVVLDTPGLYSLTPVTEEERVTRDLLRALRPGDCVVHVVDAKNLGRLLPLTLQLRAAGLPLVLVLNLMDEARELGLAVDAAGLAALLDLPVVSTVAATGEGVEALLRCLRQGVAAAAGRRGGVAAALPDSFGQQDPLAALPPARLDREPPSAETALAEAQCWHAAAAALAQRVMRQESPAIAFGGWRDRLDHWLLEPATGVPVLLLALVLGFYVVVGRLGGGILVDLLENHLFDHVINPWVERLADAWLPWPVLHDLVAGEYGVVTLGVRYSVALVLPIVGSFFLVFALFEDSGYLPRMALLLDRLCKTFGLSGRAVIPLALGFGCGSMATLATRTLETARERVIATFLLALAVPCSAQLGLILGLLGDRPAALLTWAAVVVLVFMTAGRLAAALTPGAPASFHIELPPLRRPRLGNVLIKTWARLEGYFYEVLPLFVLASVVIWLGRLTGLFQLLVKALEPVARSLGLPDATAVALLFGFFRRDYGAAGLYDLNQKGLMNGGQLAVAAVVLTLFLPCVAQLLIMFKERGWRTALVVAGVTTGTAYGTGLLLRMVIAWTGWIR